MGDKARIKRGNWGGLDADWQRGRHESRLLLTVSEDETEGAIASISLDEDEARRLASMAGKRDEDALAKVRAVAMCLKTTAPNEALELLRICGEVSGG